MGRPAKLPDKQMDEIRRRADEGEQKVDLAEEFGVSRPTIYAILKRKGGKK